MTLPASVQSAVDRAVAGHKPVVRGQVRGLLGIAVEATGIQSAVGDLCTIHSGIGDIDAEVVGFREGCAVLMPLGETRGIAPADPVTAHGRPLRVRCGPQILGRVIDALGRPLDGGPPLQGIETTVTNDAPAALLRKPITEPVETGVAAIDAFTTCGKGQRIGIFAGSGVGKSTLLGMIAKGNAADVNVIALIGERGREVNEFIHEVLGPEGMAKSVVIVATSDAAPMLRYKGPFTAVAIAESFRATGQEVLFTMDSVTRFAGAAREVGLAAGEPPTLRGYPPSLFAQLPRLVERLGNDGSGTITGLLTVLVDGDDFNEPVSDALRGHLDGHIVLSRQIAHRGNFPAVDVLGSISRLMPKICTPEHLEQSRKARALLAHYEENRDLVQVGAYRKGTDELLDRAIAERPRIEELLYHGHAPRETAATLAQLADLIDGSAPGLGSPIGRA